MCPFYRYKNPKYRPLSGIAGGCYSTMLSLIMTTLIVPILQKNGGLGSQKGWTLIIISAFVLHAVLLLGCLFAISATDKPEFYRQDPDKKEEKISIKDSLNGTATESASSYVDPCCIHR